MNSLYQQFGPKQESMMPNNYLQNAMNKARQIMQTVRDPKLFVLQQFHVPAEIQDDPDQILLYLRNNNMLSQRQIQALNFLNR